MEFIKKYCKDLLLIVFIILTTSFIMSTSCTSRKLHIAENNITALTDTISMYKLKNGDLLYEKQGYIAKKCELEKYIGVCESDIKELEKKLGSALYTISKLEANAHIDTIHMVDSVYIIDNDEVHNNFSYSDDWLTLSGTTVYKNCIFDTRLNSVNMSVPLKIGMTEDQHWFVTTSNPYISFSTIEGANIHESKPRRWSVGLQFGIGLNAGYGISGAKDGLVRSGWYVGAGFYGGIGVSYKLF